ncbi:hypothetical protein BIW11_05695, partial [Tropilaelaps mercedesae]
RSSVLCFVRKSKAKKKYTLRVPDIFNEEIGWPSRSVTDGDKEFLCRRSRSPAALISCPTMHIILSGEAE